MIADSNEERIVLLPDYRLTQGLAGAAALTALAPLGLGQVLRRLQEFATAWASMSCQGLSPDSDSLHASSFTVSNE